jgi:NAD(P)-dependent dehydrogenase (short-subunit alcohol dehydrogenase family)
MACALITGGSRGMGRATAHKFARQGHDVAITYRTRREEAEEVVRAIEALGRHGLAVAMDVGDRTAIERGFAEVETRFGKITHLFANAGLFPGLRPISEQTWEGWERLLAINVVGQWYCAKLAIANMLRHGGGGAVLYNSSISGVMTFPLASAQALEFARDGIRVNVLCPGFFRTDMYEESYGAATDQLTGSVIPAERIGDPEEIAALAYWLLVEGTYCNGSIVVADGGITAGPKLQQPPA